MKKIISSILIIFLFIITAEVNIYAQNGPIQDESEIWFQDVDDYYKYKRVYEDNIVYNEISGVTYDKNSNTLILNNVKTEMLLETYAMGDNFKIKAIGNNEIGGIVLWMDEELRKKYNIYGKWCFNSKSSKEI